MCFIHPHFVREDANGDRTYVDQQKPIFRKAALSFGEEDIAHRKSNVLNFLNIGFLNYIYKMKPWGYELKDLFNTRLSLIAFSTLKSFSPLLVNFVLSFIVIRFYSEELWGRLSELVLVINLLLLISSWSNREYLLRAFSKSPATIMDVFWSILLTRTFLFLSVAVIYAVVYKTTTVPLLPVLLLFFLKFLNNSIDPLYTYYRKFRLTFIADLTALLVAAALIFYMRDQLTLIRLCWLLALLETLKLVWYIVLLNIELKFSKKIKIDFLFFLKAGPFFAVGLISFLQSKADQFMINYFLSDADKAVYQVLTNLLIVLMAIPSYLTTPFLKNIYRMKQRTLDTITKKIFILGCIVAPAGVIGTRVVLKYVYSIELSNATYMLSVFYVLPAFYFSLKIYGMFKEGKDKKVAAIIFAGFIINMIAGFFLIPVYGISGGLVAAILGQMGIVTILFFTEGK